MSTITKELAKLFRKITNSEIDAEGNAHVVLSPADSLLINNARIALASLEAEPVGWQVKTHGGNWKSISDNDVDHYRFNEDLPVLEVYAAPPAPVSVPAAMEMDDDFDSAFEHGKAVGWNAYRAAMLQGAEPVTTAYKLPFEQWLSQQTGTIDVECGCVMTEVFFHWLRVAYVTGNSPVIPDCSCRTCRPVTMTDMRFVVCPECGNKRCPHANDHRNACTGSNELGQEGSAYPAAPQQEVK